MKLTNKLIAGLACIALPALATATPYTVNFTGSVESDYLFIDKILDSYPIGTPVSFTATFDENFYTNGVHTRGYTSAATGSMQVGSSTYLFDSSIQGWSGSDFYGHEFFGVQMMGSGPTMADGGDFFGLFFDFNSDVTLNGPAVFGLQYLNPQGGGYFSYAQLAGTISVAPAASVPEPSTAMLLLPALALVWRTRRKSVGSALISREPQHA
jgi:hypothetical protein